MKHLLVLGSVLLLVAAAACSPDAIPATTSCSSVTECAIGKVCDGSTHQCIPEPDDRFLGRFHCTVSSKDIPALQVSEVLGRTNGNRYALSLATCVFNAELEAAVIFLADGTSGETMQMTLKAGASGRVTVGPAISTGEDDAAPFMVVSNDTSFLRDGTTKDGFIELSTPIADGAELDAYLDVTMVSPPKHVEARLGEPCPNGLADCGTALSKVGGATTCFQSASRPDAAPVCSRLCTANGDCSLGKAVCTGGLCVRRCTTDADCADLGRRCFPPESTSESSGCLLAAQ